MDVSEWEPATDAEVAMRDALRTDDQESYFRILSGVDLLLPVSADALAGLAPLGWGTWSTGGRTHVLAFTSSGALQSCLADYTGSARRVAYAELANTWPNLEWWLAVNPGLPIEGYLPAWFVAQLSRGDLRLPTRGPGRDKAPSASRIQDLHSAAMAANAAVAQQDGAGGPTHEPIAYPQQPVSVPPAAAAAANHPASAPPAGYAPPGLPQRTVGASSGAAAGLAAPSSAPPVGPRPPSSAPPCGYGQPISAPPAGYGRPISATPISYPQPISAPPAAYAPPTGHPRPTSAPPAAGGASSGGYAPALGGPPGYAQAAAANQMPYFPAADEEPGPAPAAAPQSGPPAAPAGPSAPASEPLSFGPPPVRPAPAARPTGPTGPAALPVGFGGPVAPPTGPGQAEKPQVGPGGLPVRTPSGVMPSGLPARTPPPAPVSAAPASAVPTAYRPPSVPGDNRPAPLDSRGPVQDLNAPLPVRTPMANTPPVPEHIASLPVEEPPLDPRWAGAGAAIPPPAPALPELPRRQPPAESGSSGFPQGPASPQAAAAQRTDMPEQPAPGFGTPLPRRQSAPGGEPAPMTSFPAFKTPAERAATSAAQAPSPGRPGLPPPVIPGSPGSDRPARLGAEQPPLEVRGAMPVPPVGRPTMSGAMPSQVPATEPFLPANEVERDLYDAAEGGSTDQFLSTLLLAPVLVPVANHSRPGSTPGESGFAFRTEQIDGEEFLVVFTSKDRLAEHFAEPTRTVSVRFYELIRNWPDPSWSFAVNPRTPVGARYPGPQVIALASWAAEAGLGSDPAEHEEAGEPIPAPPPVNDDAQHATVMQKTLPPEQVDYYLERGYDRVAGFVHRATEVEHLRTPHELFGALGLTYQGSPHQPEAKEAYVLRWPAYRPSLYRIPYGGQNEQALKAMDGWVIERPPFRGNGFAPGEGRDVIAEFKVDSVRLPHGSQLWRIDADGSEHMIAIFDNDGPQWRRVGEQ
ncbi:hypothetical protein GCM10010436_22470 [Paractinoplanes durhamensis]